MNGRFITEPTPDPETPCEACGTNNVVYRVSSLTTARLKTCASRARRAVASGGRKALAPNDYSATTCFTVRGSSSQGHECRSLNGTGRSVVGGWGC